MLAQFAPPPLPSVPWLLYFGLGLAGALMVMGFCLVLGTFQWWWKGRR